MNIESCESYQHLFNTSIFQTLTMSEEVLWPAVLEGLTEKLRKSNLPHQGAIQLFFFFLYMAKHTVYFSRVRIWNQPLIDINFPPLYLCLLGNI